MVDAVGTGDGVVKLVRAPEARRRRVGERKVYAFFAAFRFAFLSPVRAPSFNAGDALNRTVAPALTATFSPVLGLRAERFGVSRTGVRHRTGRIARFVA